MVKNYPTLEGFFIPEALCPLAIDPCIVALAASFADAAPRPTPSHALREAVIASAAGAGLKARRRGPGPLAWLSGAGWAAAACAGVVFGLALTSHMTANVRADTVLYQASLSGADDTEVLGG